MTSYYAVDLDDVHAQLRAIALADPATAPMRDGEGEPQWGPVVVFETISRDDFREWLSENEGDLRRWWYEPIDEDTGRVVVYSSSGKVIPFAVGELMQAVRRKLGKMGGFHLIETVLIMGSPTSELRDRDQEPDATFTPREIHLKQEFPNVLMDIAYENLPLDKLHEKLKLWMGAETTVQVAIGIKFNAYNLNHVAIRYIRGEKQPLTVQFGASVVNPPPLTLPIHALYYGATIPPELAGQEDIRIDLAALRDDIDPVISNCQAKNIATRLQGSAIPSAPFS